MIKQVAKNKAIVDTTLIYKKTDLSRHSSRSINKTYSSIQGDVQQWLIRHDC